MVCAPFDGNRHLKMDFDRIANQLSALNGWPLNERVRRLKEFCPAIVSQIEADSGRYGPMPFWGRSVNFDELESMQIVDPAILEALSAVAKRKTSLSQINASRRSRSMPRELAPRTTSCWRSAPTLRGWTEG